MPRKYEKRQTRSGNIRAGFSASTRCRKILRPIGVRGYSPTLIDGKIRGMTAETIEGPQLDGRVAAYLSTGDHLAFEDLILACHSMLLAIIARNFHGTRDVVLELEQETWLKLEKRRREGQEFIVPQTFKAFKNYVLTIAKNLAIDLSRSERLRPISEPATEELVDECGSRDLSIDIEVKRCVDLLRQSSRRDAEIIELFYLQGFSAAELAERFDLNEGHVRRIKNESLDRLRRCIEGKHA